MLADPQSITISGTPVSLPRTGVGPQSAEYTSADGTLRFLVRQSSNSKTRRTAVSVQRNKIAADPLTAVNTRYTETVTMSVVSPIDGFSIAELVADIVGLATWLTASSAANSTKTLAGEK